MPALNLTDAAIRDALALSIFELVKAHEAELIPAQQVEMARSTRAADGGDVTPVHRE